eukprot:3426596-Prymnesium_polylepis.1
MRCGRCSRSSGSSFFHPPTLSLWGAWPPWHSCIWPDRAHVLRWSGLGSLAVCVPTLSATLGLHSIGGSGTCVPMPYTGACSRRAAACVLARPARPRPPARPRSSGSTAG